MCALMTPIIKSNYKLYPGMPVVKKNNNNSTKLQSNNNLAVPKRERLRSTSLRSNISAQSNPEFSIAPSSTTHSQGPASMPVVKRQRNSVSLSKITNKDDVRLQKLQDILNEKERQRKISNSSNSGIPNGIAQSNKNPFSKLLKHFGIKQKTCETQSPSVQEVQS